MAFLVLNRSTDKDGISINNILAGASIPNCIMPARAKVNNIKTRKLERNQ
jgi:hypothetical protein